MIADCVSAHDVENDCKLYPDCLWQAQPYMASTSGFRELYPSVIGVGLDNKMPRLLIEGAALYAQTSGPVPKLNPSVISVGIESKIVS